MSASKFSVTFGFLISPAAPALMIYVWQIVASKKTEAEWGATVFLIMGYIATLVFGIPTYLLFRYRGIASLRAYLSTGFVMGVLAGVLVFLPDVIKNWSSNHQHAVSILINGLPLMGGIAGLSASGIFWLIAVRDVGPRGAKTA